MGYYTNFKLIIHGGLTEGYESSVIEHLRNTNENAEYALYKDGGPSGNEVKWYSHEEDLAAFSQSYPDLVFELRGKGEDHDFEECDRWRAYFKNGEHQVCRAKLTYDPCKFDLNGDAK